MRAYKFEIKPNKNQSELLDKHFGSVRFVYNWGLSQKIKSYEQTGKTLSCFDLIKMIPSLKESNQWLDEINSQSLQASLRNLDNAFTSFFRKNNSFPKFKSKKKSKLSFQCPQNVKIDFGNWLLKLPKFKEPIKVYKDKGNKIFATSLLKTVTISKTPTGRYFISCLVDENMEIENKKEINRETTIGLDLGIKDFCILSNGTKIKNPKFYSKQVTKLGILQKKFSKKVRDSKNREKLKIRIARLHEQIANQRKDFLNKTSHAIVNDNQVNTICIEDLNVKGMIKNRHLSKAISDSSWSMFTTMLGYKTNWYGKNLITIGRFEPSSKLCSNCGYHNSELKLKDRTWICPDCLSEHDRDTNASINIKNFGLIKTLGDKGNAPSINKACVRN